MKSLLLTRDDRQQIVFTPETEFEKKILQMFGKGTKEAKVYLGSFADAAGGWIREYSYTDSLIVVFDNKPFDNN